MFIIQFLLYVPGMFDLSVPAVSMPSVIKPCLPCSCLAHYSRCSRFRRPACRIRRLRLPSSRPRRRRCQWTPACVASVTDRVSPTCVIFENTCKTRVEIRETFRSFLAPPLRSAKNGGQSWQLRMGFFKDTNTRRPYDANIDRPARTRGLATSRPAARRTRCRVTLECDLTSSCLSK
jgi:hypothetical protein